MATTNWALCFTLITIASALPWEPEPQLTQAFIEKHNRFVQNTRENGSNIQILFMGSSSIERWGTTGLSVWNEKYGPLGSANYGIGSDRTEHVLWRLENGEVDGINPKMAVIYIGSNNVPRNTDEEVVRGIAAVLDTFRVKLPQTKLLFLGIFPRGNLAPINTTFERILHINDEVGRVHSDGVMTTVFSFFWDLATGFGQLDESLFESDQLHLNRDGYGQWDRMETNGYISRIFCAKQFANLELRLGGLIQVAESWAVNAGEGVTYIVSDRGLIRFDHNARRAEEIQVEEWAGEMRFTGCAFEPKLNRMYITGGIRDPNEFTLSGLISYIELDYLNN